VRARITAFFSPIGLSVYCCMSSLDSTPTIICLSIAPSSSGLFYNSCRINHPAHIPPFLQCHSAVEICVPITSRFRAALSDSPLRL
jgi:hypothetical protein